VSGMALATGVFMVFSDIHRRLALKQANILAV
jgi:hypothetical protein